MAGKRKKAIGFAIEPRRVVFAKRDEFAEKKGDPLRRVPARSRPRKAKVEHNFWKTQRNPDELCDDILDYPMVKATWGSLTAEILAGGIGWKPPRGKEKDPRAQEAARFLMEHDEFGLDDERPLTMIGSARLCLEAVPRGFCLLERSLAPWASPIRGGKWSGKRRMESIRWLSRRIIDVEEDELGFLSMFKERNGGLEHTAADPDWWRYVPLTWDEGSDSSVLFGNGLCIPTYQFTQSALDARQAWRSLVERVGGGAVIATLSEESSTEYEEVAHKAAEMLDECLTNMVAVLPKGMDVTGRDLLAKNGGDVFKALDDAENMAVQLLWVYQVASTGTDDTGANSRARTESLQDEKSARADEIAGWLLPTLRRLWAPLHRVNFGPDVPMPVPVLGGGSLLDDGGQDSAAEGEDVAKQALNGAQVASLVTVLQAIPAGTMAPAAAKNMIEGAAPGFFPADKLEAMVAAQTELPRITAAPAREAFSAQPATISEAARKRVREVATRKLRRWLEDGKALDCKRPMPLRSEFSEAYQMLGLGAKAATEEAEKTCDFFARRLAETLPAAKTAGGRLRVLSTIAEELADPERLAAIQERA